MKHKLDRTNLMIDIETLDTAGSAIVVSIGAVPFSAAPQKEERGHEWFCSVRGQRAKGRTSSYRTVAFWKNQPESVTRDYALEAKNVYGPASIKDIHEELLTILKQVDGYIYCKGLDFDIPILESLFATYKLSNPFAYRFRSLRCWRTLEWAWLAALPLDKQKSYKSLCKPAVHGANMDCKIQIDNLLTLAEYAGII